MLARGKWHWVFVFLLALVGLHVPHVAAVRVGEMGNTDSPPASITFVWYCTLDCKYCTEFEQILSSLMATAETPISLVRGINTENVTWVPQLLRVDNTGHRKWFSGAHERRHIARFLNVADSAGDSSMPGAENPAVKALSQFTTVESVPRVCWVGNDKDNFASIIATYGRPIIVMNTTLQRTWPAVTWTHSMLKAKIGDDYTLRGVHVSNRSTLWFHQGTKQFDSAPRYNRIDMRAGAFFENITAMYPETYLYYFGGVEEVPAWNVDVQPITLASPRPDIPDLYQSTSIWIGSSGVTSHMHFDYFHNFFLQVVGQKELVLLPPESYERLHLFPRHHPLVRRTQVDFDALNVTATPNIAALTEPAFVATLSAGEMLYLPPVWFHYVTNLDAAISVNTWTESRGHMRVYSVMEKILKRLGYHPEEQRIKMFQSLMGETLRRAASRFADLPSPTLYGRRLYELRYKPLMLIEEQQPDPEIRHACENHVNLPWKPEKVPAVADSVVALIPSDAAKLIVIDDFADLLAHWAVPDHHRQPHLILLCL